MTGASERAGRSSLIAPHVALALLGLHFVLAPMLLRAPDAPGAIVATALVQGALVVTLGAFASRPRLVVIGLALVVAAAALQLVPTLDPSTRTAASALGSALALSLLLLGAGRRFFHERQISSVAISLAVSVYLLAGTIWSLAYTITESLAPGSFSWSGGPVDSRELHYFSYVTQTTLGYGDLAPRSDVARVLAVTQAIWGQLFLAVVLARMVGLWTSGHSPTEASDVSEDNR